MDNAMDAGIDFQVVVNDEEQYSIWPAFKAVPAGWRAEGPRGPKEQCLSWIGETWKDMRPASLRRRMAASEQGLHGA